jgi:hypothetical protein
MEDNVTCICEKEWCLIPFHSDPYFTVFIYLTFGCAAFTQAFTYILAHIFRLMRYIFNSLYDRYNLDGTKGIEIDV